MGKQRYDEPLVARSRPRTAAEDGLAINHVTKATRKKAGKGLEVVFDPAQHKDFITGFRKRKLKRRKDAERHLKSKERQARLAERSERRAKLKEQLGLGDNWGVDSDQDTGEGRAAQAQQGASGEAGAPPGGAQVAVYEQAGTRTVVTTAPLSLNSDSDDKDGGEQVDSDPEGDEGLEEGQEQRQGAKSTEPSRKRRAHGGSHKGHLGSKKHKMQRQMKRNR